MPYLLQSLALLKKQRDVWHLEIVGDGPARLEYEQLVHELDLLDRVTFHDMKLKLDVAESMRQSDLFILTSV